MLKTWREEYRANQAMKRQIELEQWEQEKRWREEDRAARQKVLAENAVGLEEHNDNIRAATGVSYLTLVCHEDTWTFMAIRAFGQWKPAWTQSTRRIGVMDQPHHPGVLEEQRFTVDPNLPEGRIRKLSEGPAHRGMQEVILSGHNLAQLMKALYEGVQEDDVAASARCSRLYNKLVEFVDLIDPSAESGQTTGVRYRIDDSLDAAHVTKS
ncbi:hypothetical protein C5L38_33805 (plasmid) [Streptomyces sp. WAC00288]|uniref:hypothetical protein n=1 Tax=unclassified Streptomyces TaxID=2593676 RepID=UPI000789983C|nr:MULTISPECIES: hypothetical protein [unclassified Streptomyces]AVI00056.1 hypothetical protein C5L38_33805 [Streptomyces sp. WAC00288]KYG51121.1 hypothetical protein AWI43_32230 [Streptomyces sp. WAC04657]